MLNDLVSQKCRLQTKTSSILSSGSQDTIRFVFSLDNREVYSVELPSSGRWDSPDLTFSHNFDTKSQWDTVLLNQQGILLDSINFDEFVITCNNGKFIDFVKLGGCSSLWFDSAGASNFNECHSETASQTKIGTLGK